MTVTDTVRVTGLRVPGRVGRVTTVDGGRGFVRLTYGFLTVRI